ncbi:MAG: hypothetical protein EHM58_02415 [Ignavibacteriae bacterium]|nr:MAG: hypothetical protein EHM58_02415 [Ignavibacteriota bacterium]
MSLLMVFNPDELKMFADFLSSKCHITNKKLYPLLTLLTDFFPTFKNECLTKQYLFENLYPGKEYHDSTIRNLLSELLEKCEEFLTFEALVKNDFKAGLDLLHVLSIKKQNKLFLRKKDLLQNIFEKMKLDNELISDKIRYDFEVLNFNISNQSIKNKEVILDRVSRINISIIEIIIHSVIEIIERELKIFVYNKKFNLGYNGYLNETFICSAEAFISSQCIDKTSKSYILYKLYILLFKTFKHFGKKTHFKEYKKLIERNIDVLSNNEIFSHFSHMITYCMVMLETKNPEAEYKALLYNIYEDFLQHKYYKNSYSDYIDTNLFRAIVVFGIKNKDYTWLRELIKNNIKCIKLSDRDKMYNYSMAQLECAFGNSIKALDHINKINLDYFIYKYDTYNLKLKIYYLNGYYEEALCLIHTYKAFLRNNEIKSKTEKHKYKRYIEIMELLIQYRCGIERIKLEDIAFEMKKDDRIVFKEWLIEEVQNIETLTTKSNYRARISLK